MKTVFPFNSTTDVVVAVNTTGDGEKFIQLFDAEDGCPYATASKILPIEKEENEIFVKDYAENKGVLNFLVEHNIVQDTGKTVRSGYVELNVCILNPQEVWGQFIHQ